jgi:hypothetical protein
MVEKLFLRRSNNLMDTINIYADESCHLENDRQKVMVLGAVWCPSEKTKEISKRLKEIKVRHGFKPSFEAKWTKVSPSGIRFYLDMIDYFFDDDDLHFRALIIPDKSLLDHPGFQQTHDVWYYKMYFDMLKILLSPRRRHCIYLDIKDTQGGQKTAKLREVLCNNFYDFSREIIARLQLVRSEEVGILQLADLLIGAVCYANRGIASSRAKLSVIERIRQRSGYSLLQSTLYQEGKFNLFRWRAAEL